MQNSRQIIHAAIHDVIEDLEREVPEIHDQDALVDDLGLKSLDLARIVAMLELKLEVDPFAELVSITSIRTVGDLCNAYAQCFAESTDDATAAGTAAADSPNDQTDPRARQRDLRKNALRGG